MRVALKMASKGKKKRPSVKRILADPEKHIDILERILKDETYHPLGYQQKIITDRGSGKKREISIPKFFPDQVVQWALILVIKPILMRGMHYHSCASIDNRGASQGIKYLKRWLSHDKHNSKYCLKTDIKKFYPNIEQDLLMQKFERKIKCVKTIGLINKIVKSISKGVPIGNVTSQWFANFYLQDFDNFAKCKLRIPYYIRYMDDMIFLSPSRRKLKLEQFQMEKFLKKDKLTIKPSWSLFKVGFRKNERKIDFLGYKFLSDYISLRSKTFLRAKRRIIKSQKKKKLTVFDAQAVISYLARFKVMSSNLAYSVYLQPHFSIAWCRKLVGIKDRQLYLENLRLVA